MSTWRVYSKHGKVLLSHGIVARIDKDSVRKSCSSGGGRSPARRIKTLIDPSTVTATPGSMELVNTVLPPSSASGTNHSEATAVTVIGRIGDGIPPGLPSVAFTIGASQEHSLTCIDHSDAADENMLSRLKDSVSILVFNVESQQLELVQSSVLLLSTIVIYYMNRRRPLIAGYSRAKWCVNTPARSAIFTISSGNSLQIFVNRNTLAAVAIA